VNSDRIDIQLPSLVCNPPIAKDPKRTPATVSLSLTSRSCRKTSYRNYVLRLERKTRLKYYCILHRLCPILRCALGRHHCNQVKSFQQTKHTCCDMKAVERERGTTQETLQLSLSLSAAFVPIRCALLGTSAPCLSPWGFLHLQLPCNALEPRYPKTSLKPVLWQCSVVSVGEASESRSFSLRFFLFLEK